MATNTTTKTTKTTTTSPTPAGFTASQWRQLQSLAKTNPSIASLMSQYTSGLTTTSTNQATQDAWRRVMPTNTSQLLKQLSYNAGETGMPGGYVGAIQLPAYGSTQPPVNNPDMTKYGQGNGIGEATFYQQSIKGGMAPIAAMSPLGVPEGWNPGGTSTDTKSQLDKYLASLGSGRGSKKTPQQLFQQSFENFMKKQQGGFNGVFAGFGAADAQDRQRKLAKQATNTNTNTNTGTGGNNSGTGTGTGNNPGLGIPISLPYGF